MRIKFLKDTDVELADVPRSAWGCLLKTARPISASKPQADPASGQFVFPTHAGVSHYFPAGVTVELPTDDAATFVLTGAAEYSPHPGGEITWGEPYVYVPDSAEVP